MDIESGPLPGGTETEGWGDAAAALAQQQQQQQLEREREQEAQVAANEALIEERAEGIGNLAQSIQEVADIYQDLALLVQEQGTHIENIQTNIETAAAQTHKGVQELQRANRYQKNARFRLCLITLAIIAVLVGIVLFLKFGLNKRR